MLKAFFSVVLVFSDSTSNFRSVSRGRSFSRSPSPHTRPFRSPSHSHRIKRNSRSPPRHQFAHQPYVFLKSFCGTAIFLHLNLREFRILGGIVVIIQNQLRITISLISTTKMIIAFSNAVDEALVFHVETGINLRIKCTMADTINMTGTSSKFLKLRLKL